MKTLKDTIEFVIPPDVPMPRFNLFQKVHVNRKNRGKEGKLGKVGTISGMYYDDFNTTMLKHSGFMGWHYIVNYAIGASQEKLLRLIDEDPIDYVGEDELKEYREVEVA